MPEITQTQIEDIIAVAELVSKTTQQHILEHFTPEGKQRFLARIEQDVTQAITNTNFVTLKVISGTKIVGFAALKDGNYLTQLFVATEEQNKGLGKLLLNAILEHTKRLPGTSVRLRSAPNAVQFYQQHGFEPTDTIYEKQGIRYVPMSLNVSI
ncbi:GNAT family N-acetyltransferase [Vibrio sp. PNB22_2_2]